MVGKTVIFDMDGVIFDTENLYLNCWRQIAGERGMEGIEKLYRQTIGLNGTATRAAYAKFYGEDYPYEELSGQAMKMFFDYVEKNGMPMKAGVREVLEGLSENGYQLGLASSTREAVVRSQLAGRELLDYFQVVIGGDMVDNGKPAPDIFLAACREIGTSPEEAYAVEDSYNGVRAAAAAGMKTIMVPDLLAPDDEMRRLAFKVMPSLVEVRQFFLDE